ncbi:hypothetical protein ACXR2T_10815 [Leucobacter sp. HY1910]
MATIALRPGALDRVQKLAGIANDQDFARAIGVAHSTLYRAKTGQGESPRLIAGLAKTFGYSLGEIAVAIESDPEDAHAGRDAA